MSKEKALGNFKISDAVKRPVTPSSASQMAQQGGGKKKGGSKLELEEAPSAGFPNLEKLIESDSLDKAGLAARRKALEDLAKKGDNKAKAGAKKALTAYDHVEDLLDYLWDTKARLAQGNAAPAETEKAAPKGKGKAKK